MVTEAESPTTAEIGRLILAMAKLAKAALFEA